jgi:hypothetical protein
VGVKDGSALQARKWVSWLDTDGVYYIGYWDGKFPRHWNGIRELTGDRRDKAAKNDYEYHIDSGEDERAKGSLVVECEFNVWDMSKEA